MRAVFALGERGDYGDDDSDDDGDNNIKMLTVMNFHTVTVSLVFALGEYDNGDDDGDDDGDYGP